MINKYLFKVVNINNQTPLSAAIALENIHGHIMQPYQTSFHDIKKIQA